MCDNGTPKKSLDGKPRIGNKRKNSNIEEKIEKIARKELLEQKHTEASEDKSEEVLAFGKHHRRRRRHYFNAIRAQMEFYFGDANLSKDRFLKKLILQDSFVPLEVFMTFNKMKTLAKSVEEIAKSLSNSNLLVLDETGTKVRRKTDLPETRNVDKNTLYVESLPLIATHDWIRDIFERFGPVSYVSLPKYSKSRKIKEFGFVEFANESSVTKAIDAFKEFNGVLNISSIDPADLSSIKSFVKEQNEKSKIDMKKVNQDVFDQMQQKIPFKPEICGRSSTLNSSAENSDGGISENINVIDNNTNKKKKIRMKKKNSKCCIEHVKENESLAADAAYFELKILPKSDWKRLRNKYLNLQRQKIGELKRKFWQERQLLQQLHSIVEIGGDHEETDNKTCCKNIGADRKLNAGMNMNFYGAGDDDSVSTKGTKEAKRNPALERAPHFSYEKGLIVEITLLEPCINIKEFKKNMRQHATVKYVDIKEGSMVAYLRLESASAAEEFVQRINNAEFVCRVLTDEQDESYWHKIEKDREEKLNKQMKLPQKRGREKIKKLINQHMRFED